jgi:transforming growth factor-beta-induced protein
MEKICIRSLCAAVAMNVLISIAGVQASEGDRKLIAAKTDRFTEKEGFERQPKDIINSLKSNEVAPFQTLFDGLQQAFELDKTLKNQGPFTLFAPTDKAFKKMSDDDVAQLFANKKKLKQVLMYHIVPGNFDSKALRDKKKMKTMEGSEITITEHNGNLYADKSLITITDVPCTNGVMHVLEQVIMPPLGQ